MKTANYVPILEATFFKQITGAIRGCTRNCSRETYRVAGLGIVVEEKLAVVRSPGTVLHQQKPEARNIRILRFDTQGLLINRATH
jgi:hypothetical protein